MLAWGGHPGTGWASWHGTGCRGGPTSCWSRRSAPGGRARATSPQTPRRGRLGTTGTVRQPGLSHSPRLAPPGAPPAPHPDLARGEVLRDALQHRDAAALQVQDAEDGHAAGAQCLPPVLMVHELLALWHSPVSLTAGSLRRGALCMACSWGVWHAYGVHGMLVGCTACSWGMRHDPSVHGTLTRCTAHSQGAWCAHGACAVLTVCMARS